ncbi:MAG: glycosyltransferase [Calditrichaeota bacterium]|nr:glycosyltransferase [Calditrichota bacterium]MCB9369706.1 glycosyltransferase [Calditrichota bacterium]
MGSRLDPQVTVGLPVYNAEAYLVECLESIKAQTLKEFEVLAILDCPTDKSAEILRKHADSRFRIVENPKNLGLAATCNRLLELSQTELLARMDADDVMIPARLEKQVAFMHAHPEVDILGTQIEKIDEHGQHAGDTVPLATTPEGLREQFRTMCALWHPTIMFRVSRIQELGGYPDSRVAEDLILYLRGLSRDYLLTNLPDVLVKYRVHPEGQMNRLREASYAANDEAYAEYGPLIWGDRAPDFVAGRTRWERLRRRMKRNVSRLFNKT